MTFLRLLLAATALTFCYSPAFAEPKVMTITSTGVKHGERIPDKFAFCVPDGKGKVKDGGNVSPQLNWEGAPAGTKSYALIVNDPDVPTVFTDANQDGKVIPESLARKDFAHWVLVDIPTTTTSLEEGINSTSVSKTGKTVSKTAYGTNGKNDFATFMKGSFKGYDGPCPPWNDAKEHHYHFTIYALDVATLGLKGDFTAPQVLAALKPHVLGQGELVGTFSNKQ